MNQQQPFEEDPISRQKISLKNLNSRGQTIKQYKRESEETINEESQ